jgi:Carboxypeptidase regulatory-like domain/TonB-dependent Receptor Plug Domain
MESKWLAVFSKTNIMKTLQTLAILVLICIGGLAKAQSGTGEIRGRLIDSISGEPIPFGNILALQDSQLVNGALTDDEGYFSIKPIPAGTYNLQIQASNYMVRTFASVKVNSTNMTYVNIHTISTSIEMKIAEIYEYRNPLISKGQVSTMQVLETEEIRASPYMDVKQLAATQAGVYQEEGEGGSIYMRGAREDGTAYFIDGVRVIGDFRLPKAAILEMKVLNGGIPASIGDATGGVIMITTKGYSNF